LAVPTVNRLHGGFHLCDGLFGTGIERVLDHRLLGASAAPTGGLQRGIGTDTPIDRDEALRASQQGDDRRIALVGGRVADRLLGDLHLLADGAKQIKLLQMHAEGGATGVGGAALHQRDRRRLSSGRLRHGA
jgi:hypothetical protein